jgi:enamine deaminase RidA (YjgF/YER057c/UK114 family)
MALDNLDGVLSAAGATLEDIVQLFRFIVDIARNQDAINAVLAKRITRRVTSTTVEVTRLATDPKLLLELTTVAAVPG